MTAKRWLTVSGDQPVGDNHWGDRYRITDSGHLVTRKDCLGPFQACVLHYLKTLLKSGHSRQLSVSLIYAKYKLSQGELAKWIEREKRA